MSSNVVLSSQDLLNGKKSKVRSTSRLYAPIQMVAYSEKDDEWKEANLDWYEHVGLMQLRSKSKRIIKNYNLADGVIDKTDYIPDQSENASLIESLTMDNESPLELRFYPIIPNVINVLTGEFSKRNNRLMVRAIDEFSLNEMLEAKKEMVMNTLISHAQQKIAMSLSEQGVELESEEGAQAMEQAKTLPEIQEFFNKTYRGIAEQWGTHELKVAEERFKMYELENITFRDSLITNEEFWHINLIEDDYMVERWHPLNTFYHLSPDIRYVSDGNYVGRILMMSISDVIDRYGYMLTEDQIKSLEKVLADISHGLVADGNSGTAWYDTSKSTNNQVTSVHYEQSKTMKGMFDGRAFMDWIGASDDIYSQQGMMRVTEVYWKSQKKVGHLYQVNEVGEVYQDIVGEDFVITEEPIYDDTISKKKSKLTLLYGQHIDWVWVNEVWKGIKIGSHSSRMSSDTLAPIYLNIKPLEFQFKGEETVFGCKLPVEGFVYYNQTTKKSSLVEQMKPFQIGFNLINNQIIDMLADEIGNVILFDQNMIPRNSLDGSWGKHNFVKAYQVMKDFGFMPIDTTLSNTEMPINWNQTSVISLEKTNLFMTRIKLGEYFKNEALAVVGITPQRLGSVASSESATGVQMAVNNSYAQTEMYFVNHSNFLMPRVKQMILNAAQYINSTKKNIRMAYSNSRDENVFFEMEGHRLLLADFNVFCMSKPDQQAILEQIKQLAINNNTSNASMYDLAKIIESPSINEVLHTLQNSLRIAQEQEQAQKQHEQELLDKKLAQITEESTQKRDFEAEQAELDRANERYVSEVRALGFARDNDVNTNNIPDPLEVSKFNAQLDKHNEDILFRREQEATKRTKSLHDSTLKAKALDIQAKKLEQDRRLKEEDQKIIRENMKNDLEVEKQRSKNRNNMKK
jgi:hypothetical protein